MKNKNITLVAILFTISVFMAFANGPAPQTIVDTDQIIDGAVTILKTDGVAANDLSNVTPATGRSALGLGTISTVNSPVPVANGGTAATDAATARTNLGVAYGTAAGTVCQGNDTRLADARTPTAHGHSGEEVTSGTVADARIDSAIARDSEVTSAVSTHAGLTTAHGATGAVVGTTNTQTLTNKSISGEQINSGTVADARIDAAIARDSELTTHGNLTAAHGATGAVVGTTNTQTLTNKSISGEQINSGTVADARIDAAICRDSELTTHGNLTATHGATGAVVGTTNTQTLTNKSISGEQINSGTVADARIDATIARDSEVTSAVSTHAGTAETHGATGAVVGTTNTQTLTNKSISGEQINSGTVADARVASTLARDSEVTSAVSTHAALTATHGATGAVVGTTNTQSLTNKTLDSTNSIAGEAVKSGTVADARIDAAIARDSEVTSAISTHAGLTATHGATGAIMGTTNTQTVTNKTMGSGCAWGGTAVPVANGGTGKTTAAEALAALGGASLNGSSTVAFNALSINGVAPLTAAEKTQALVGSSTVDFAAQKVTVGSSTATATTRILNNGFTQLGELGTGIKMKVLTGTTAAAEGGVSFAIHGLNSNKIVSWRVQVNHATNEYIGENYSEAGYQFKTVVTETNINVLLSATESENILEKPFKILVWYVE